MYDIRFDPEHRILHVAAHGLWTPIVHAKFVAEVFAKGIPARVRYGAIAVLADLRAHPMQPAELNGLSKAMMARAVSINAGPMAIVVGSVLGKLQAEQMLQVATSRIFLDHDAATAWLQEGWIDRNYKVSAEYRPAA